MPPKKASQASPGSQRGGGRLVAPSPARSTRSARSHRGDDYDNESESGHVFKVPTSRNGRANGLSLVDTSVNIAAAFNAAQAGYLPTPNTSAYSRPHSRNDASGSRRALSPAEQLADSARALSPVRYFLHPTDNNDSGDFNSFSSLVNPSSNNTSYDYQQEEEYVKAKMRNGNGHTRTSSESRRKKKAMDGDMPYRPAEDDWAHVSGESDVEGEGLVSGGALAGRAATRGKTKEKGEGYLGAGLGIQPRRRRNKGDPIGSDDEDDTEEIDQRHSPAPSHHGRNGFSRSPTPAQQLMRAISPLMSPGPRPIPIRRRQPSSLRTIVTNILHGIVDALRFVTDLLVGAMKALVLKPIEIATGSSKQLMRRLKHNWWKMLGAMIAFSLLVRLLNRAPAGPSGPSLSDSSYLTLNDRLDRLERAISGLSGAAPPSSHQGATLGNQDAEKMLDRISLIEATLAKPPVAGSGSKATSDSASKSDLKKLRSDLQDVSSKVNAHEKSIAAAQSSLSATQRLERDLRLVEKRVDQVEDQVRAALDDGRLRSAIERILPDWMPIKISKGGRIDVEPVFWAEMKKVLAGKDDVDKAVQAGLAGIFTDRVSHKEMEQWGERLFATKAANGLVITRDQFLQAMGNELEDLKTRIDQDRQQASNTNNGKTSATVIKSHKGDDLTSMLQELVDAAILKYSKDTLATPDYALFTAGARVVPSITSDTLLLKSAPRLGKWLAGMKDVEGRSPATALHPDNSVGSCWPFQGSQGQLGVLLSRRVVVSDITIEHAAKELSPDITSAPKSIEVWGLVEGEHNKARVSEYISSSTQQTSPSSVPPSSDHLLLATFEYDPQAENPIQTFPVPPAITEMGIDMGIIVVKVESNWGGDLTCLYRVRVHGRMSGEADTD